MRRQLFLLLLALLVVPLLPRTAAAATGQPVTNGLNYDRNPSVVQDGPTTKLFFARSRQACNRLAGCDADNSDYDLYMMQSQDGGRTFGPAMLVAANPGPAGLFRGRTVAATRIASGLNAGVYVFWASGANADRLYVVKQTGPATFSAPALVPLSNPLTFNVEALGVGPDIYLYTEEFGLPYGVYARRFDGAAVVAGPTLVSADKNLPKGLVDNQPGAFRFRLTYVDASAYPTVRVLVNSSVDGLTWMREQLVIAEPGVAHWDPQLAQRPNGNFYLYSAPQEDGSDRQRVAVTMSNNFTRWAATHEVTPAQTGGVAYWDYWPEGFTSGNRVLLFYTSERETGTAPTGIGHIWSLPGGGEADN